MTDKLRTQLADYGAFHEERQGSVDIDSLFDPVTPIPTPVETRHTISRGWLVAVAAGIAVILVIGLIPFLLRDDSGIEPVATTVPPSLPTTTSIEAPSVVGLSFTGVTLPENAPAVGLVAATELTPGDGTDVPALSSPQVAIELSLGRVVWAHYTSGPLLPQGSVDGGLQVVSVREEAGGHVLTGQESGKDVAWFSSDGSSWVEWSVDEPIDWNRGFTWVDDVWAASWQGSSVSLWALSDGLWREVETPADSRSFVEPVTSAGVTIVGGVGKTHDILIVVDDTGPPTQIEAPWTRLDLPEQRLHIVALPDSGFAALVMSHDNEWPGTLGKTGLWTSTNGTNWIDHGEIPFVSARPTTLEVVDTDDRPTVEVYHDVDETQPNPAYWETQDGVTWTPTPAPEPLIAPSPPNRTSCDAEGSRCVETDIGLVGFFWNGRTGTELWISPDDGITWEHIPPPPRDFLSDTTIEVQWNTPRNPDCCMLDLGATGRVIWWNDMDDGLWLAHVE